MVRALRSGEHQRLRVPRLILYRFNAERLLGSWGSELRKFGYSWYAGINSAPLPEAHGVHSIRPAGSSWRDQGCHRMVLYAYSPGDSHIFWRPRASVPGLASAIKALEPIVSFFNLHIYSARSHDDPHNTRFRAYRSLCT
jgi:hypothetical protein